MNVELTQEEKAIYEWQIWEKDFGEEGQKKLKESAALVSRVGGLGSPVADKSILDDDLRLVEAFGDIAEVPLHAGVDVVGVLLLFGVD